LNRQGTVENPMLKFAHDLRSRRVPTMTSPPVSSGIARGLRDILYQDKTWAFLNLGGQSWRWSRQPASASCRGEVNEEELASAARAAGVRSTSIATHDRDLLMIRLEMRWS